MEKSINRKKVFFVDLIIYRAKHKFNETKNGFRQKIAQRAIFCSLYIITELLQSLVKVFPPAFPKSHHLPDAHQSVVVLLHDADPMASGPARMQRYQDAEQMILDEAVWISLYHYASRGLIKPYVKGL